VPSFTGTNPSLGGESLSHSSDSGYSDPSSAPLLPRIVRSMNYTIRDELIEKLKTHIRDLQSASERKTADRIPVYEGLCTVWDNFKTFSSGYVPIFIHELPVPPDQKTVKPDDSAGGLAGGQKIQCIGSFRLKNPVEVKIPEAYDHQVYRAKKSAKHEFNNTDMFYEALLSYKSSDGVLIMPPPCLLIDYVGHRLLVSLDVPLDHKKRCFGKSGSDEGAPDYDEKVCALIQEILGHCGLKNHSVTASDDPSKCCVLPFDAEVFKSTKDGKVYYVVDLARCLPPNSSLHSEYLTKIMRKEFVKYYFWKKGKKLSNDAFHPLSRREDNADVNEAIAYYNNYIPAKAVGHLLEVDRSTFSDELVRILHFNGLNLRDMGMVYEILCCLAEGTLDESFLIDEAKNSLREVIKELNLDEETLKRRCTEWMKRIEVEACARSFRRVVDSILFEKGQTGELSDTKLVISILFNNAIAYSKYDEEDRIAIWKKIREWKDEIFPSVIQMEYPHGRKVTLSHWAKLSNGRKEDLLSRDCIYSDDEGYLLETFLKTVSDLIGIYWDRKLWEQRRNKKFFQRDDIFPFTLEMLDVLYPRVLESNLTNHTRGVLAMDRNKCGLGRDYERSVRHFQLALDRQPTNEHSLDRYRRALKSRAREFDDEARRLEDSAKNRGSETPLENAKNLRREAAKLRAKADHWIEKACSLPDMQSDTYFSGALLMIEKAHAAFECGNIELRNRFLVAARDMLENALKKDPNHRHAGFMLADVLRWLYDPRKGGNPKLQHEEGILPEDFDKGGNPVIKYVIDHRILVGEGKGNNAHYHLFVFYLTEKMWKEAIDTAFELYNTITSDPKRGESDKEIIAILRRFFSLIESA